MKTFSLTLVALGMAAVIGVMAPARSLGDSSKSWQRSVDNMGRQDFDFLVGEWRVHHRRLKFDTHEWLEFDGTCSNRKSMNGSVNIEEHMLNAPSGTYSAIALRSYDSKTQQWAIWWLDSRYPLGPLDPPVNSLREHSGQYLLVAVVKVLELQLIESYDPTTYLFENPTM